tara:strand:+ start:357 stop:917 length:561 start_codon:yes stop_codon:yes gene_type:complete
MKKYQKGGSPKIQAPGKKRTLGGPKLYSTDSRKEKKQKLKELGIIKTRQSQLAKMKEDRNKYKTYLQKGGSTTKKEPCPKGHRRNSNGRCTPVYYTSSGEYKYTKKDGGKCTGVRCKERPEGLVGNAYNERKVKAIAPIRKKAYSTKMKMLKTQNNINSAVDKVKSKMGVKSKMMKGGSLRRSIKH